MKGLSYVTMNYFDGIGTYYKFKGIWVNEHFLKYHYDECNRQVEKLRKQKEKTSI